MLEKYLYICPGCKQLDVLKTVDDGIVLCQNCGMNFQFDDDFKLVSKNKGKRETKTLTELYEIIRKVKIGEIEEKSFPKMKGEKLFAKSKTAELFQEVPFKVLKGYKGIRAQLYKFKKIDEGNLYLSDKRLLFIGKKEHSIGIEELSSCTIESHMVIINTKRGYAFSFEFLEESGKKWEDIIRDKVVEFYGVKGIREFQPKIAF